MNVNNDTTSDTDFFRLDHPDNEFTFLKSFLRGFKSQAQTHNHVTKDASHTHAHTISQSVSYSHTRNITVHSFTHSILRVHRYKKCI